MLELGIARGEGRQAIASSIWIGTIVALANLVVLLAVFHYLKV